MHLSPENMSDPEGLDDSGDHVVDAESRRSGRSLPGDRGVSDPVVDRASLGSHDLAESDLIRDAVAEGSVRDLDEDLEALDELKRRSFIEALLTRNGEC